MLRGSHTGQIIGNPQKKGQQVAERAPAREQMLRCIDVQTGRTDNSQATQILLP